MGSRKYNVLIVSKSEKTVKGLSALLPSGEFSPAIAVCNAGKARYTINERKIDFVIINTPLPDDFGIQLATDMAEKNLGVLLLVRNEAYDQVAYKVESYGVATLAKPVSKAAFIQAMKLLRVLKLKLEKMEVRAQSLESKMKEIRIVNRAKWILIDQLNISEEKAHKYIERTAMNKSLTKRAVAENIIKRYEG